METFLSDPGLWIKIMVASIALFLTLGAAWIGADFFSKLNAIIFSFIVISITTAIASLFFGSAFGCTEDNSDGINGFTGIDSGTFSDNFGSNYGPVVDDNTGVASETEVYNFFRIFGIVFPAMTGIMAGANLSGDLRDPGRSIGRGTLYAIGSSLVVYAGLAALVASSLEFTYLQNNKQALQEATCWPGGKYFIVLGIVSSTMSSALGAMTGAARVLQAFCKDFSTIGESNTKFGSPVLKVLRLLAKGTPDKNEPRNAVLLTWAIAQALLLLGSLDLLASIITNCFLLTYFFTNFACFILKISGAPNFRPKFRYFSWHTALLGAILNVVIMFLASPLFATISIVLMMLVFGIIVYSAPEVPWGDVSQALIYHQVRKYLLRLDERKAHPKFWRPSILLIVNNTQRPMGLIDFCNNLKKGGLYVIGDVILGNLETTGNACLKLQDEWNSCIPKLNVKAFSEVVLADTYRRGCQSLMLSAGLGGMKPNTVVLPLLLEDLPEIELNVDSNHPLSASSPRRNTISPSQDCIPQHGSATCPKVLSSAEKSAEFVGVIRDALFLNKNLLVAKDFDNFDKELIVSQVKYGQGSNGKALKKSKRNVKYIDIWFTDDLDTDDLLTYSGNLSLMIQLAHGLNRTDIWQECSNLRIVHLVPVEPGLPSTHKMVAEKRNRLESILNECRVEAALEVFAMDLLPNESIHAQKNAMMRQHTDNTAVLFINLPLPVKESNAVTDSQYMFDIAALTHCLPPTVLSVSGKHQTVIATEI